MKQKRSLKKVGVTLPKHLQHINVHAAGIDIGSRSHFVAVPEGGDEKPVREFSGFTGDLERMAEWSPPWLTGYRSLKSFRAMGLR
jgi:transposase